MLSWNIYFEIWALFIASLNIFIANLEHVFLCKLSWIGLKTLFPKLNIYSSNLSKLTAHRKYVHGYLFWFYFQFQQVLLFNETSYLKVSQLQIIEVHVTGPHYVLFSMRRNNHLDN